MARSPSAHELIEMAEGVCRKAAQNLEDLADYLLAQNKIDGQEHNAIVNATDRIHEALDMGRY